MIRLPRRSKRSSIWRRRDELLIALLAQGMVAAVEDRGDAAIEAQLDLATGR